MAGRDYYGGRKAEIAIQGGTHCGHPKKKAVPRGIETEDPDKMAQHHYPMRPIGPAHPHQKNTLAIQ